ncbi:F-box protein SKIP27-like [Aristolochia californica]|uniref:F-box protein SKIP27-like n=1 Tax=Aristolochia californica TaxID=171875 RepID=UPI0035D66882
MALGKNSHFGFKCDNSNNINETQLGICTCTRAIGRKRVIVSSYLEVSPISSPLKEPKAKRRGMQSSSKSRLEALPQDLLVRVLCGVNHDDLKQLFQVSKTIREAALIAKQWHFAFTTPAKVSGVKTFIDSEEGEKFDNLEAPDAPRQHRTSRFQLNRKKLSDISVALFQSSSESWPRTNGLT